MTAAVRDRFLDELAARQGAPYVWGGKGLSLWSPTGLIAHPWTVPVYDCAGLVTVSLMAAGGPDLRATHSAQTLFDASSPAQVPHRPGTALFYGSDAKGITHVAIVLGCGACPASGLMGRHGYWKVEAAGGGRGTTTPQRDLLGLARVTIRRENRADLIEARDFPLDWLDF